MKTRARNGLHLLLGIVLVIAGSALLLDNQGLISIGSLWRYWPLLLAIGGIVKIVGAQTRAEQGSGVGLLIIGFWLAASLLHWWDLSFAETWPVVFIAIGASTLWKGLPPMTSATSTQE